MKTIAIINQKGGVGKTTTVANLGAAIADRGRDTCLIDLDPQAHLTLHFGLEPGSHDAGVYDVMIGQTPVADVAVRVGTHLRVAPSVIDLAAAEAELVATVGREHILRDRIAAAPLACELLLIDCPPSLGLLTLNALAAADEVFIPLQPHFLALQGLGKLLETVDLVRKRINPRLRVSGVILCMYETATRLAGEVVDDLRAFFDRARGRGTPWSETTIFRTVIRRNIKLAECPSHGVAIFDYEPHSRGAEDYNALAEEVLAHLDGRPIETASQGRPDEPAAERQEQVGAEPAPPADEAQVAPSSPQAPVENAGVGAPSPPGGPSST